MSGKSNGREAAFFAVGRKMAVHNAVFIHLCPDAQLGELFQKLFSQSQLPGSAGNAVRGRVRTCIYSYVGEKAFHKPVHSAPVCKVLIHTASVRKAFAHKAPVCLAHLSGTCFQLPSPASTISRPLALVRSPPCS